MNMWGESQRKMPPHEREILSKLQGEFSHVPVTSHGAQKRGMLWLSFAFVAMAVILVILPQKARNIESTTVSTGINAPTSLRLQSAGSSEAKEAATNYQFGMPEIMPPLYQGNGELPVSDTRSFLKTSYRAEVDTRHVGDNMLRAESLIRSLGGRIDTMTETPEYGYLGFVVPSDRFAELRIQIKNLEKSRFIRENINAQNLLPQKQSLEEQDASLTEKKASLTAERNGLIGRHNRTIADLGTQYTQAVDSYERQAIQSRIDSENASYRKSLASYDAQIKSIDAAIAGVKKSDKNLLDNVATVNGVVSFDHISTWEYVHRYTKHFEIPFLLLLAALFSYVFYRRTRLYSPIAIS